MTNGDKLKFVIICCVETGSHLDRLLQGYCRDFQLLIES
jgi:hypothetical protein